MSWSGRASRASIVLGFSLTLGAVAVARQAGPPEGPQQREMRFLQGLRERGYYDLALEYLNALRRDPKAPRELKVLLDYDEGLGLLEEAAALNDLERRRQLLEKARTKLDAFVKANPNHVKTPEAFVAMARLQLERGQTAALQGEEAGTDAEKRARVAEARAAYDEARKAYDKALQPLRDAYAAYPSFLPEGDPRRAARDHAHVALMDAELQRALVDYEEAQTYRPDDPEHTRLLDTARAAFKGHYDRYRSWVSGFFAHMWEAKCLEEKGDFGPAIAIYKELLDQPDPSLAPLKRKVGYFRALVHAKRGEHPIVIDLCDEWLRTYPNASRSDEGVGVRFQLAKSVLARLPEFDQVNQEAGLRRATDLLTEVVRYYSPFKAEAIELLKKYRPAAAQRASQIANMSYDEASAQADSAISTHEWDRAIQFLKQAVRRAGPSRDIEKANLARLRMAYCYYELGNHYAAAALAEHLARNYPKWGQATKAAGIGLASWTNAYNTFHAADRGADLEHLIDLATYTAATWPDTETGDSSRFTLGEIALGRGRYADAIQAFMAVRDASPRRQDALVKAGDAHWRLGAQLRDQGKSDEANVEATAAENLMKQALEARRAAQIAPTDPGLITNVNALAEIYRAGGRPKDALALLGPTAQALDDGTLSTETARLKLGLLTIQLRAHLANGQPDKAIEDMAKIEKLGDAEASLTQLYFELGRSLKREMDALETKIDSASRTRLKQTREAYGQFLEQLSKSEAGQTYDSLMFAGESLLGLNRPQPALALFDKVLATYDKDPEFQKRPGASERLLRARLRRAEALRKQRKFTEARAVLEEIRTLTPRQLELLMEEGRLLEDQAAAETDSARWNEAYNHWKRLAGLLDRARPRRVEYFEAQLHAAMALQGLGQQPQAVRVLKGVMTLYPTVGNPDMKKQYEDLLGKIDK